MLKKMVEKILPMLEVTHLKILPMQVYALWYKVQGCQVSRLSTGLPAHSALFLKVSRKRNITCATVSIIQIYMSLRSSSSTLTQCNLFCAFYDQNSGSIYVRRFPRTEMLPPSFNKNSMQMLSIHCLKRLSMRLQLQPLSNGRFSDGYFTYLKNNRRYTVGIPSHTGNCNCL